MRLPLLARHLLLIRNTGSSVVRTVGFDANGGAGTNGLLTLTDDDGANTVVFNTSDTLAKVVVAVNALTGWVALPHPGLLSTTPTKYDTITQRLTADVTAATHCGEAGVKIPFANTYEIMPASATTALQTSIEVPLHNSLLGAAVLWVDGADGGATGDATFNFANNALGNGNGYYPTFPDTDMEAGWDTTSCFATAPAVAINAATEVRETTRLSLSGLTTIKLLSVGNADDAVVNVDGHIVLTA